MPFWTRWIKKRPTLCSRETHMPSLPYFDPHHATQMKEWLCTHTNCRQHFCSRIFTNGHALARSSAHTTNYLTLPSSARRDFGLLKLNDNRMKPGQCEETRQAQILPTCCTIINPIPCSTFLSIWQAHRQRDLTLGYMLQSSSHIHHYRNATFTQNDSQRPVLLPDHHPLLDLLPGLLLTPASVQSLLNDPAYSSDQTAELLEIQYKVQTFLLNSVRAHHLLPIVKSNNLLGAFHVLMGGSGRIDLSRIEFIAFENSGLLVREILFDADQRHHHLPLVHSILSHASSWAMQHWKQEKHQEQMQGQQNAVMYLPRVEPITIHDIASVCACGLSQVEYENAWEEAIEELPELLLDDEHREYIKPYIEYLVSNAPTKLFTSYPRAAR